MMDSDVDFSFAQLWRERSPLRRKPDVPFTWDDRIAKTPKHYSPGTYSQDFLELAQVIPGESVFDMGCGAGTLAIPCAQMGCPVTAVDFSPGMLTQLNKNAQEAGLTRDAIDCKLLSWSDDWCAAGIQPKSYDVAFASRSIITHDLADSLSRLNTVARRKVCVTAVAGCSPRCFPVLLHDLGLTPDGHQDAAFVFAVACELGLQPEVRYIDSSRTDLFTTRDEAFQKYASMLDLTVEQPTGIERNRVENDLRLWLNEHLVTTRAGSHPRRAASIPSDATMLTPDIPRIVSWAFISWNPR